MTPWFFTSFILVNIFRIPTNLFWTLIRFFRKTSAIAMATLQVLAHLESNLHWDLGYQHLTIAFLSGECFCISTSIFFSWFSLFPNFILLLLLLLLFSISFWWLVCGWSLRYCHHLWVISYNMLSSSLACIFI